jgi:exopolysaccharide biosynthesis polyprenyl glycosylphosphotransferase
MDATTLARGLEVEVDLDLRPLARLRPDVPPATTRRFATSKEQLRLRLYLGLFVLDLLSILVAFLIAGALRTGSPLHDHSLRMVAVMVPTFMGVAINNRAYSLGVLQRPATGLVKVSEALLFAVAAVIALLFYLKVSTEFSRLIFAVGTALSFAFLITGRSVVGKWIGQRYKWSFANRLVLVDGVAVEPKGGDVVMLVSEAGLEPRDGDPLMLDRLSRILEHCDRVVLACPPERRHQWAQLLKGMAIDVELLMPELSAVGALEMRAFHGETTLVVSYGPLGMRDRMLKRTLDTVIAAAALIVLSPVMLAVAVAIKLDSAGPVLFRQQRVGKNNRLFGMIKFRSMRTDCADAAGDRSASRCDERLTHIGGFLRRTSLDELPQLINVIKGDMSIVGPRPHALGSTAEEALFWHIDARYFHRHAIKPGMTGLAQIRGFRGATICRSDLTNRLQADLDYQSGWSIWRDLRIILSTFRVVTHNNAF